MEVLMQDIFSKEVLMMAQASKADRKAALDVASWIFNIVTSVGIIIVNKALMATYGYSFGNVIRCFNSILFVFFSTFFKRNIMFSLFMDILALFFFNNMNL